MSISVGKISDFVYGKMMKIGAGRYSTWLLLLISYLESFVFPIPVDPFFILVALSKIEQALKLALLVSFFSILGGISGYLIGSYFIDAIGYKIIEFYSLEDQYILLGEKFEEYNFISILVSAISPLPYKLFTIAAGGFKIDFATFLIGSIVGRTFRFALEGILIYSLGRRFEQFLARYLGIIFFVCALIALAGFYLLYYW